ITLGLGVRVLKGDATGYAYTEDLAWERMLDTARTAAQIAAGGGATAPALAHPAPLPSHYSSSSSSLGASGSDKVELLRRADRAARAFDARIGRVEVSLSEEIKEILIVTSHGTVARDRQPLVRFGVRAVAEADGRRQSGNSSGGGRMGLEYFDARSPEA